VRQLALVFALVACGGKPPPPKPAPPLGPTDLAALIYSDFTALAELARRQRGKCTALTAELKPHVARMRARQADVERMLRDAKQAGELKTELAAYAERSKPLADTIAADLATTYLTCCPARVPAPAGPQAIPKTGSEVEAPTCDAGYQLERVIADLPTY
jgi:hypothetical protein